MDFFLQIPAEIQLMIGSYFPDQTDYYNLSLVCKRLRPIGEQLLYSNPDLNRRPFQGVLLARTILSEPKLGKLTKTIQGLAFQEISGRPDKWEHDPQGRNDQHNFAFGEDGRSGWRSFPWPNGWSLTDEHAATIREMKVLTHEFLQELGVGKNTPWRQTVDTDLERAIGGALLAAMPNLTEFELNEWRHIDLPAQTLPDLEIFLGKADLNYITCLKSLELLRSTGAIPWALQHHFQTLKEIGLYLLSKDSVEIGPYARPPNPPMLASVTEVTLYFEVTIFLRRSHDKLLYVQKLLHFCPRVDVIDVVFLSTSPVVEANMQESEPDEESWEQILKALRPARRSVRALYVSFAQVISETGIALNYFYNLPGWDSLSEFTNLFYLTAPMNALRNKEDEKIYLPGSLTRFIVGSMVVDDTSTPWRTIGENILESIAGDEIPALALLYLQGDVLHSAEEKETGETWIHHTKRKTDVHLEWDFDCNKLLVTNPGAGDVIDDTADDADDEGADDENADDEDADDEGADDEGVSGNDVSDDDMADDEPSIE